MAAAETRVTGSFETLWDQANTLAVAGRDDEALPLYRSLAENFPDTAEVWSNMAVLLSRQGRTAEAIRALQQAVQADPMHFRAWFNLASLHEVAGDLKAAAECYGEALLIDPANVEALRSLGFALHAQGQTEAACAPLKEAHRRAPDDPVTNFYLGNVLSDLGETAEAMACLHKTFELTHDCAAGANLANLLMDHDRMQEAHVVIEQMLAAHPEKVEPWVSLGGYRGRLSQLPEAKAAYEKALSLNPQHVTALHNLGRCLSKLGEAEAALAVLMKAARVPSANAACRRDVGLTLKQLRRFDEAERWLREALAVDPGSVDLRRDIASVLKDTGQLDEALVLLDEALALAPRDARILVSQAGVLADLTRYREAAEKATEAVAHADGDVMLLNVAGSLFERLQLSDAAVAVFRQVVSRDRKNRFANSRLFDLLLSGCDWSRYDEQCERQVAAIEEQLQKADLGRTVDVFNLQALRVDYAFMARAARQAAAAIAQEEHCVGRPPAQVRGDRKDGRIRLGYALAYTHFHSLPMVLDAIVPLHDRDRFELFGYSINVCDESDFSRHYRGVFDHFRDIPGGSAHAGAELIGRDGIDVLIDTTGLTGQTCMPIMAYRPAPVQIHGFGYSITTGAEYIDYLITDRTYIPPELAALGPEQPIYLPDTFMPAIRPQLVERPARRADFGLPEEGIVFCNFNHPCKFEPTIFAAWMRILQAVPDSVLWFGSWIDTTRRNLQREAEARGVARERLIFADIVGHKNHLGRLRLADLALDNLYHGGGVTTLDALAAGVPVLSVLGETPAARLGATLLQAAEVPDLICRDLGEYEARAIALAGDAEARAALNARLLAGRDQAPLFDSRRFVRALEAGIEAAWQRRLQGLPADVIDVPAPTA